jgi:hypothetical protein
MAITLPKKFSFSIQSIPWRWIILGATILGCGYMGQQLYIHGLDKPISDATIRGQQLRLSADALQSVVSSLDTYHAAPTTTQTLTNDPLTAEKPTTTTTP